MRTTLRHGREGFLKVVLLGALIAAALPAQADELLVGALRDQDGAVVAGAAVAAVDARGTVLGRDRSAADGTFALTTPVRPAAVVVTADDADALRIAVPAGDAPLAAIVRRHRAADLLPSVADVAALPAGDLSAVGSVLPYRIAFPDSISDRWLARGRGVTSVEGLPFYRRGDGGDATSLLPAHAFGALDVRGRSRRPGTATAPAAASRRAPVRPPGRAGDDQRDGAIEIGRNPVVLAATSWDAGGLRRLLAARANGAFGPVREPRRARGQRARRALCRRRNGAARIDAHVRSGRALRADRERRRRRDARRRQRRHASFDVAGRGPNAIALRARWRDERGMLARRHRGAPRRRAGAGTTRGSVTRVTAAVAFAYGDERLYEAGSHAAFAVLPSLARHAARRELTLHLGSGASTLGTPGFGIARASLGEAALAYTDRRRLRAELVAYTEGTTNRPR